MFHAAVLLWVAGISHLLHGDVDKHAMAWLLVGSIPGVLIGSHLSIRVPERSLRIAFGVVLMLSGIKLVGTPHANYIDRGRARRRGRSCSRLVARARVQDRQRRLRRVAPRKRRRIDRAVARVLSTAFCVALLAATAAAFALTEGAKTELSPIYRTHIDKVFSPTCNPQHLPPQRGRASSSGSASASTSRSGWSGTASGSRRSSRAGRSRRARSASCSRASAPTASRSSPTAPTSR